ncbi:MAG: imidazoleglycerol-phosphate dehydratase HisB [Ferroplasma sp.]
MIRNTNETKITVNFDSDNISIDTGDLVFDHMLKTLFFYMKQNVNIKAAYDLRHHLWEDTGITIAEAIKEKIKGRNITRFGSTIMPMDDSLILLSLDISRAYINFNVDYKDAEGFELNLLYEFLWGFSRTLSMTLHVVKMNGTNPHHITENIFKALGISLKIALEEGSRLESTKGVL